MLGSLLKSMFQSNHKSLEARDLATFIKENPTAQLIDVRGVDESQASGTIPGATVAPLNSRTLQLTAQTMDKSIPTIVFCRSGMRSRAACDFLSKQGFTELYNLAGGHMAYERLKS